MSHNDQNNERRKGKGEIDKRTESGHGAYRRIQSNLPISYLCFHERRGVLRNHRKGEEADDALPARHRVPRHLVGATRLHLQLRRFEHGKTGSIPPAA